eukprot:4384276-Pyramimonas_sp.AAC.1
MICIQDTGHRLVWHIHPSSISNTAIDELKDIVLLFVEHQVTFHFFVKFTRPCSGGHNRMPRLVPSPALPTCVADTFNQVESGVVQITFVKMSLILSSFAWNPRKCSFRNSRVTTLRSRFRKFCRLNCTSNRDQSGSRDRAA